MRRRRHPLVLLLVTLLMVAVTVSVLPGQVTVSDSAAADTADIPVIVRDGDETGWGTHREVRR